MSDRRVAAIGIVLGAITAWAILASADGVSPFVMAVPLIVACVLWGLG